MIYVIKDLGRSCLGQCASELFSNGLETVSNGLLYSDENFHIGFSINIHKILFLAAFQR